MNISYLFDLDNTLCVTNNKDYENAKPKNKRIAKVNKLYDKGYEIKIETARGAQSGKDWSEFTKKQLAEWGVKYHVLRVGVKMHYDILIDDKAINDKLFFHD